MSTLHPFPALRPPRELAARVSSLPYDVMNHREAEEMASGNDASFLHICRSDIDTSEALFSGSVRKRGRNASAGT